ncbi:MarR family winged helix-turn-helix transcriptional regulator [Actinomycetota bacterium]
MTEAVPASGEPRDLADLLARIFPRLAELEGPILEAAGLSMWEYAIMTELASAEAVSQTDLSRRVRRDPTRLGRHLDALEERGLVSRTAAEDRRQRTVSLTREGNRTFRRAKQDIRGVEDALVGEAFTPDEAAELRRMLQRLAEACAPRRQ